MSHQITKEYHFSAAHMILGHPKCGRMHGHNYRVEVTLEGPLIGPQNWILDFGQMDELVKPIIESLDHRFILTYAEEVNGAKSLWHATNSGHEHLAAIDAPSSSAESLAEWIASRLPKALVPGFAVSVCKVVVWETAKACGIWVRDNTTR